LTVLFNFFLRLIILAGQLQAQSLNSAAVAADNAKVSAQLHYCFWSPYGILQLKQHVHEFELRLERQASQVMLHYWHIPLMRV